MQHSALIPSVSRAAAVLLTSVLLAVLPSPVDASGAAGSDPCFDPASHGVATASAARGGDGVDHRVVTVAEQREIAARTSSLLAARRPASTQKRIRVPVRVHVMAAEDRTGNVRRAVIERQVAAMNQQFAGSESELAARTRVRFALVGVDRWFDDRWHRDERSRSYRRATRIGGARVLNIWLVGFQYLGVATFPWDYEDDPDVDGIRVDYRSLPGGSQANYDEGKTATHEAGHWLGLFHTFQGGCSELNDEVHDTAAQADSTAGCPEEGTDTCELEGVDPIHNYMDYSYDACMDQFTPGQKERMRQMWRAYRR